MTIVQPFFTFMLLARACGGAVDTVDKEGLMTLAVVDGDDVQEYSVDLSEIGSSFRKKSAVKNRTDIYSQRFGWI